MPKGGDGKSKNKKTKNAQSQKEKEKDPLDLATLEIVTRLVSLNGDKEQEIKCLNKHFEDEAWKLYPMLGKVTYKVPDVHFNKGKTIQEKRSKQSKKMDYLERKSMTDCSARGDRAHVFVLNLLVDMSKKLPAKGVAPLFIINSYHSDHYLYRLIPHYKAPKNCGNTSSGCDEDGGMRKDSDGHKDEATLPGDLGHWNKRGEMDIMVLKPGMVVFIETKSTGDNRKEWEGESSLAFGKKVKLIFVQLDRNEDMFNTNMEETIRKSIKTIHRVAALPNLSLEDIDKIVKKRPDILSQDDVNNPKYKLLCSDSLKSVDHLTEWWLKNIEEIEESSPEEGMMGNYSGYAECDQMNEVEGLTEMRIMIGRYLCDMSLVSIDRSAQISGPFREVRRKGQAVNTTGFEFSQIALTKDQVDYINSDSVQLGYLNGPPGSGKTLVLAMRARWWILDNNGVTIILNMYRGSEGRSIGKKTRKIIYKHENKTMREKLKKNCHEIAIDVDNFDDKMRKEYIETVFKICEDRTRLLFLVDETYVQSYWQAVFDMLMKEFVEDSHIWLAGLYGGRPDLFQSMALKEVIRCPPNVQKVLKHVDWIEDRCKTYIVDSTKANMATDGADVMVLPHKYHQNPSLHPAQCCECGEDLVAFLENTLEVVKPGAKKEDLDKDLQINALTCQDIVLLVNLPRTLYTENISSHLDTNEKCYTEYMKLIESSPLIQKLNENKYPTKVHTTLPRSELVKGKQDVIHVSWVFSYQGLENKVVIFLPAGPAMLKEKVLNKMKKEERGVWEDATRNIPCPGLIGRYSDQWDKSLQCHSSVEFLKTCVDNAVDPDAFLFENNNDVASDDDAEVEGGSGFDYGRRRSTIPKNSDTVRKWKVEDLDRYNSGRVLK